MLIGNNEVELVSVHCVVIVLSHTVLVVSVLLTVVFSERFSCEGFCAYQCWIKTVSPLSAHGKSHENGLDQHAHVLYHKLVFITV